MSPTDPSQSVISCQKASCRCIYQKSVDILGPSLVRPEQQQPKKPKAKKETSVSSIGPPHTSLRSRFFLPACCCPSSIGRKHFQNSFSGQCHEFKNQIKIYSLHYATAPPLKKIMIKPRRIFLQVD
jgi:hypothetical protein